MLTAGGARALRLQDEVGTLEVGKKADIILVDHTAAHMRPTHNLIRTLAMCATPQDVKDGIVAGAVLMRDRMLTQLDEANTPRGRKLHIEVVVGQHDREQTGTSVGLKRIDVVPDIEPVGLSPLRRDVAHKHSRCATRPDRAGNVRDQQIRDHAREEAPWTCHNQVGLEQRADGLRIRCDLVGNQEDSRDCPVAGNPGR